jgi:hypothetical protein
MTTASRNIMAELNNGEKLNGENYKIWAIKIQYVLKIRGSYGSRSYSNRTREIYKSQTH